MRASVGVGVGPIRLSQGLGLGVGGLVVVAVASMAAQFGAMHAPAPYTTGWSEPKDGSIVVMHAVEDAEAGRVHPGKYRAKAPAKPNPPVWLDDGKCMWAVYESDGGAGKLLRSGDPKPGEAITVTLNMNEELHTDNCGAWVWQQK
jgi:hypothetical protein